MRVNTFHYVTSLAVSTGAVLFRKKALSDSGSFSENYGCPESTLVLPELTAFIYGRHEPKLPPSSPDFARRFIPPP
jgi:hypothetical protein